MPSLPRLRGHRLREWLRAAAPAGRIFAGLAVAAVVVAVAVWVDWPWLWAHLPSTAALRSSVREDKTALVGISIAVVLLHACSVVLPPLPASPVTVSAVVLVGPVAGFGLSLAGMVLGSVAAFALGRRFGWRLVRVLTRGRVSESLVGAGGSDGWWLVPVVCLPVPLGGDVACFAAGMSAVRLRRFCVLITVSRVPGTMLAVVVAVGLGSGSAFWIALGLAGFALLSVLARHGTGLSGERQRASADG